MEELLSTGSVTPQLQQNSAPCAISHILYDVKHSKRLAVPDNLFLPLKI